jgi:hypothetical protein
MAGNEKFGGARPDFLIKTIWFYPQKDLRSYRQYITVQIVKERK